MDLRKVLERYECVVFALGAVFLGASCAHEGHPWKALLAGVFVGAFATIFMMGWMYERALMRELAKGRGR